MRVQNDIIETIGNTPLVRLRSVAEDLDCTILAKVESFNPGGSVKDRIGPAIIDDAEQKGLLKPGGTIVEATSGNTGVGLAIVVYGVNMFGDAVRDMLDARIRGGVGRFNVRLPKKVAGKYALEDGSKGGK